MWPAWSFPPHLPTTSGKRGGSAVVGEILLSQTVCDSPSRSRLDASLLWQNQTLPLLALIDSGADESFLDSSVVAQLAIDTVPLDLPIDASALNGQHLARVTQRTVPVTLRLSGNHQERISFHVVDCPSSPLVLGHPWLRLHNPQVDWSAGKVSSWSRFVTLTVCILPCPLPLLYPSLLQNHQIYPQYHQFTTTWRLSSVNTMLCHYPPTGPTTVPLTCSLERLSPVAACTTFHVPSRRPWRIISGNHWRQESLGPRPLRWVQVFSLWGKRTVHLDSV